MGVEKEKEGGEFGEVQESGNANIDFLEYDLSNDQLEVTVIPFFVYHYYA